LCSDPAVISPCFDLVQNTKARYGILDEDTYSFDEIGFIMGAGGTVRIVTASERHHDPIADQPGKREWVTSIAGVNALGWTIPPFLILKTRNQGKTWH
jgi:hypothetical protein